MMAKKIIIIIFFALILIMLTFRNLPAFGFYQDYPKDGKFKQISAKKDYWYFFDAKKWYIKAPDKFQHMMGSYALSKLGKLFVDEYAAGAVVLGLGLYKEYDDALREGWSPRDLLMDALGVAASVLNNDKYKIWMDWDQGAVILKFSVSFK